METTLWRLAAVAVAAWSTSAQAQLYTPPKGSGSVSATLQVVTDHWHLNHLGDRNGESRITNNSMFLKLDYGITDRLAATFTAPYVHKRFRALPGGAPAHNPDPFNHGHGDHDHIERLDDGEYHGSWQDLGVGLRYRWLDSPVVVTPFINYAWPATDYTFFAHGAPGTLQKRTQLGVFVGRLFGPPWINTYAQASYSYTFVEEVLDFSVNYSTLTLEIGQHFSEKLSGRLYTTYRKTHGGLDFPIDFLPFPSLTELTLNHDRIQRIDYVNGGGGIGYQLNDRYYLSLDYLTTLWGENGHEIHNAVALSVYYSF